jgi:hypothetical protein
MNKKEKPVQYFRRSTPVPGILSLESTKFLDSKNTEEAKSKEETSKISESNPKHLVTKKATQFTDKSSTIMQPTSLLE